LACQTVRDFLGYDLTPCIAKLEMPLAKSAEIYAAALAAAERTSGEESMTLLRATVGIHPGTVDREFSGLVAQPMETLDTLLVDAAQAQLRLKQVLAPRSVWAGQLVGGTLEGPANGWADGLQPWIDACCCPGVKKRDRIVVKASYKYPDESGQPQYQRVRDMARLGLQFNTASRLLDAIPELYRAFEVVEFENRFVEPTALGWMDITMLVRIVLDNGRQHIAELQLQLAHFADARTDAHAHYAEIRKVLPEHGVSATDLNEVQACIVAIMEQ